MVSKIQPGQDLYGQGHYSKVKGQTRGSLAKKKDNVQRSLLYLARFSRYKHFCVLQKIKKLKMSAIFGKTKIF